MVCKRGVETLIVCLGNERVCDDGIGARAGRILESLPLPDGVTVTKVQSLHIGLLDQLAESERLLIIDALSTGAEPGMCTVADVTELPSGTASADCAHARTVANIMDLVRHVSCDSAAPSIDIAGIQGKQFMMYGAEFSAEVSRALPRLVDLVLLTVGAQLASRAMVRDVCRELFGAGSEVLPSWQAHELRTDVTGL